MTTHPCVVNFCFPAVFCPFPCPYVSDTVARSERNAVSNPLNEIRNIRINKAATMRDMGLPPYPSKSRRTQPGSPNHNGCSGAAATSSGAMTTIKNRCWTM